MGLQAAITSDIDTLNSIYHGIGCKRSSGYTFAELRIGLENFCNFLDGYGVKATMFIVGEDLEYEQNIPYLQEVVMKGHEIGNHTYSHAQSFRLMNQAEKESEIKRMDSLCQQKIGVKPVGFRCAGWNISSDAIAILKKNGYLYDSSVHPTSLTLLLKTLQWLTNAKRSSAERTTLGESSNMFAPLKPYITHPRQLWRRGKNGIIEFPLTVTPILRLPFYATFLLSSGRQVFNISYELLKTFQMPIVYSFHLSDFVDYTHKDLKDQVPSASDGVYIPKALLTPLSKKMELFKRAMDKITKDYSFTTLKDWALTIISQKQNPKLVDTH